MHSLLSFVGVSRYESFPKYELLLNKRSLPQKSVLLKFNVYLDDKNIMRVGGRLDNSEFLYNKKNILVYYSPFINLLNYYFILSIKGLCTLAHNYY